MKTLSAFSIFLFACLFLQSSCINIDFNCKDSVEKTFKPLHYSFIVTKKSQKGRYNVIEGIGKMGEKEVFSDEGFDDLYDTIQIGDSLKKNSGQARVFVINNKKTMTFYAYCDGQVVE
jgi:hypothetical protein